MYSVGVNGQSGRKSSSSDGTPTSAEQKAEVDEVVRVRTDEVLLPVSVRDWSGTSINGLNRDDFIVYDEGSRQVIRSFNR